MKEDSTTLTVPSGSGSNSPRSKTKDDNLSELKKQRGILKGRLTLFAKYIQTLSDIRLTNLQLEETKLRMQTAEEIYAKFCTIENEIELSSAESEQANNLEYVQSLESSYFMAMASAKCLIEGLKAKETSSNKKVPSENSQKPLPKTVNFPEIKLPTFDGSYDHWIEFKNTYVTLIHNCSELNPTQKFHYLRSSLSGSALQVISALEFTNENYYHAWEILLIRYNNSRLLIQNHLKSLFNMPAIRQESFVQYHKLIDTVIRNLRCLQSLGEPTEYWDTLIVYLMGSKLDPTTEREWEQHKGVIFSDATKRLTLEDMLTFLQNKANLLESITHNKQPNKPATTHSYVVDVQQRTNNNIKRTRSCVLCKGNHPLFMCTQFLNLSVNDRLNLVDEKQLCINCLRVGHSPDTCIFGPCKQCQEKHNSLLHLDAQPNETIVMHSSALINSCVVEPQPCPRVDCMEGPLLCPQVSCVAGPQPCPQIHTNRTCDGATAAPPNMIQQVILCTALVEVADSNDCYHTARALLDNGSEHCFITERLSIKLNSTKLQSTIQISGVGQVITKSNQISSILMRSRLTEYSKRIKCFVLPHITSKLPSTDIITNLSIPPNFELADPCFDISSEIDLLIGADVFWELLETERIRLSAGPYLQRSKLGWLLSGPIYTQNRNNRKVQCNFAQTLDVQLRKFWELEEVTGISSNKVLTDDERKCEEIFINTTKRESDGRFSVRIPLKESPLVLGDSYLLAQRRFVSLERKLDRSPQYKKMYCDFIQEYIRLNHMTRITEYSKPHYFLPHHGVFRESSSTTKLRVVFDASATTSSSKSLNDIQYAGPALQNDIFSILLRFRQFKYVACADVEKMFRQVLVQDDQRSLQLILWRESPADPLDVYKLNTVTYGTASAPYLSMRCLRQLASETADPIVSRVINDNFFVDDLLLGNDNYNELLTICEKTSQVLRSGCFPLRKWTFNKNVTQSESKELAIGEHTQSKTLGLGWCNETDELHYTTKISEFDNINVLTKRTMLSIVSQIYDPLGLLAPAVIISKILLQKLWLCKIDWDAPVSRVTAVEWDCFIEGLQSLNQVRIKRHVKGVFDKYAELHIFSDASQNAYGACVYLRTFSDDSEISVQLLCAKSKVSPLKSVSIPRLELCGALVGARLYKKILESVEMKFTKVFFWTDSTIVMGWIRMSPHLLKTFIQNRVTEINDLTGDSVWLHIGSKDNPADLLSRGLNVDGLINNRLWWNGPQFLQDRNIDLNSHALDNDNLENLPELRSKTVANACTTVAPLFIDFDRYSCYVKLKRIFAYVLRFIYNVRIRSQAKQDRQTGSLSVDELNAALVCLIRHAQEESFGDVFNCLRNNLPISAKCNNSKHISSLNVFLDDSGVIRVGGRLSHSTFSYGKKYPVLLSSKHRLCVLLFENEHKRLLHASPQLLLSNIREHWWPLGARNLARKVVRTCVVCTRMKGRVVSPIMGDLPSERLESGFPFMYTGVDYAGPMLILNRKGRGGRLAKAYVCLFICFSTRAIHLELVTSLTTDDYLLALKRFISRRGKPKTIFSDNGTTFVGALKELSSMIGNNLQEITDFTSNNDIALRFIPSRSPHFGGLWESAIKSCKYHLTRIIGNANLTYEEFSTVLCQIEAVLNSRPMTPLSTDPSDLSPLTPSHFLIGRPLSAPASADLSTEPPHRLTRYGRIEQLRQHFWQRWSREYVADLQLRSKWKINKGDIPTDTMVLIKEDNLPPLKWRLGRITRVYPGKDGISRVADIRTATGEIRRSFSKICPLPVQMPVTTPELPTTSGLHVSFESGASKAGSMSASPGN